MNNANIQLLVIDPQNDFCDLPEACWPIDPAGPLSGKRLAPALPVPGAHADMQRLAAFLHGAGDAIHAVTVTLDAHHRLDIAHPACWEVAQEQAQDQSQDQAQAGAVQWVPVSPFTAITAAQVRAGRFRPSDPAARARCLAYLDALEATGRYQLMVWPVHCEIGSWGQGVHADLRAACDDWEARHSKPVSKIFKGSNRWTEHYSALQAEVPDADDPATQLNGALLLALDRAGLLLIAGLASSHCVKATTEHLVQHLPGAGLERLVLLTDCMSPVAGFEAEEQAFFAAMQARGLRLASSREILAELCPS